MPVFTTIVMKIATIITLVLLSTTHAAERQISLAELRDKVRGAWAGKMIGVAYGAPTEFRHQGKLVPPEKLPQWQPDMIREALRQDDLYVQMTYSEVLDAKGLSARTEDFAEMLKESRYPLWHTSQAARRALRRGATFDDLASPKTSAHGEDISFQIIADFIGLSCPAMPRSAVALNDRVARVAAWGDGVCAGRFVAAMYSAAYFETDPRKIIESALATIPPEREYALAIRDVLEWHRQFPDDWQRAWKLFNEKWDNKDRCPQGALEPLNIDAKLNGGYTAIGLLYGGDDFEKVLEISTRCGQDSDCNPCTAAGVFGAARGFAKLPARYTDGLPSIAQEKFIFTNSSFDSAVENAIKRAILVTKSNGGRVENNSLMIIEQSPQAPPVRDFPNLGNPAERIPADDARWKWQGTWNQLETRKSGAEKFSAEKGASATISFTGTGAIIAGPYIGNGGRADVFIDDKLARAVDTYSDDPTRRVGPDSVFHIFNLPPGDYTIRLLVRGEPYADSKGAEIHINSLIVFR